MDLFKFKNVFILVSTDSHLWNVKETLDSI